MNIKGQSSLVVHVSKPYDLLRLKYSQKVSYYAVPFQPQAQGSLPRKKHRAVFWPHLFILCIPQSDKENLCRQDKNRRERKTKVEQHKENMGESSGKGKKTWGKEGKECICMHIYTGTTKKERDLRA